MRLDTSSGERHDDTDGSPGVDDLFIEWYGSGALISDRYDQPDELWRLLTELTEPSDKVLVLVSRVACRRPGSAAVVAQARRRATDDLGGTEWLSSGRPVELVMLDQDGAAGTGGDNGAGSAGFPGAAVPYPSVVGGEDFPAPLRRGWRRIGGRLYRKPLGADATATAEVLPAGIVLRPAGWYGSGGSALFDPLGGTLRVGTAGVPVPEALAVVVSRLMVADGARPGMTPRLRIDGVTDPQLSRRDPGAVDAGPADSAKPAWSGFPDPAADQAVVVEPAATGGSAEGTAAGSTVGAPAKEPAARLFAPPVVTIAEPTFDDAPAVDPDHRSAPAGPTSAEPPGEHHAPEPAPTGAAVPVTGAEAGPTAAMDPVTDAAGSPPAAMDERPPAGALAPPGAPAPARPASRTYPDEPSMRPEDRSSTPDEQRRFAAAIGEELNKSLATVNAALAAWPALRRDDASGAKIDYVAVCLYLGRSASGAVRLNAALRRRQPPEIDGYLPCLVSGLRRLPLQRRPVVCQGRLDAPVHELYRVGSILSEPGFRSASVALDAAVAGADIDFMLWGRTARQVSVLVPGRAFDEAIFSAGTRFKVLAVRAGEVPADRAGTAGASGPAAGDGRVRLPDQTVLLREVPPEATATPDVLDDEDTSVLARLDRALGQRRSLVPQPIDDEDLTERLAGSLVGRGAAGSVGPDPSALSAAA